MKRRLKNKAIKHLGNFGLIIILIIAAAILVALGVNVANVSSGRETLLSAFGGAFFAYVFVRMGELFKRLSDREKLNIDTLVEVEYILNDHLNRIDHNAKIVGALIEAVENKSPVINFMKIKAIPIDRSNLRDMKNLDFINDMFNYYVDLEKINEGLELVLSYAVQLVNENRNIAVVGGSGNSQVQQSYKRSEDALVSMANNSKDLLKKAEKDCIELIAKSKYVFDRRSRWLSLAYTGSNAGRYGDDLKDELPKLIEEFEKSREDNR